MAPFSSASISRKAARKLWATSGSDESASGSRPVRERSTRMGSSGRASERARNRFQCSIDIESLLRALIERLALSFALPRPTGHNRLPMSCGTCSIGTLTNPGGNYVGVRLADSEDGKMTIVLAGEVLLKKGERIIVETDQGPEFAEVVTTDPLLAKPCSTKKARRLLRLASDSEFADFIERLELQDRAFLFVARRIAELGLPLKLAKCAVGFDRRKILVVYSSEERVNLRDLLREVSEEFHTRVEAKLVGVRDETKLMVGIGPCGLTLCCSTWLRGFHPVTIKMAKLQGITPNPAKLTGMCGRLKCCIAYELEGGIEGARRLGARGPDKKPAPP